ncbi:transketolase [Sphaerotilus hippei]|uniref:Transketolase n=1 Tax=Sphaerotilus hippei TaxID=744406 RepID=A0A318GXB5_9BURK|nr:transketolase [Sphaerotilus hippei]PXW94383.1 transketolase [Sphaerotilus hippei]
MNIPPSEALDDVAETDRQALLSALRARARRIRRLAVRMGAVQGQGYVGQALGVADLLAVLHGHVLRFDPAEPRWPGRDRFLLSCGHYAIALYAALIESGVIPDAELETYGSDDSRLPMSGMASYTPGMEISGGSLGQGLTIAVGMALGLRHKGSDRWVINLMGDGELDEGSTWEAAQAGAHHRLGRLMAIVDANNMQADGPSSDVMRYEPLVDKWVAFGWRVRRVDGHDVAALVEAFDDLQQGPGDAPCMLIVDTRLGRGVPFLEGREKAHFIRVDPHEWDLALEALAVEETPA